MRRSRRRLAVLAALSAYLVALAAPAAVRADDIGVNIEDFAYEMQEVAVQPGRSVHWINRDDVEHTASSDTGAWDTGTITPGLEAIVTFKEVGTFPYHCAIHPAMKGVVHVVADDPQPEPGASEASGDTVDGDLPGVDDGGLPNTSTDPALPGTAAGPLLTTSLIFGALAAAVALLAGHRVSRGRR